MHVLLPKKFHFNRTRNYIENDNLFIASDVKFRYLMYSLTYAIHKNRCYYCGKKIKNKKLKTIDHVIPRALGGITVTNNLVPACEECNNNKAFMSVTQFHLWNSMRPRDRKEYEKILRDRVEKIHQTKGFDLPESWIEYASLNQIDNTYEFEYEKGKKYEKVKCFYETYGKLPRPIVVDNDYNILESRSVYIVAKDKGIKEIPVVRCDNIITLKKPKKTTKKTKICLSQ